MAKVASTSAGFERDRKDVRDAGHDRHSKDPREDGGRDSRDA